MTNVAAIVLAAGRGMRFGESPKLLAILDGMPLVRHVAEAALASECAPVLVVTGHESEAVSRALAGLDIRLVDNPDHAAGLSTSLNAGMDALPTSVDAAIVLLGDMPLVTADLIDRIAAVWRESGRPDAVVPTHAGRRGNPVLLSRRLSPELATLTGDVGAGLLLRNRAGVLELPVDDEAVSLDVDTPDSLRAAQLVTRTTPSRMAE